MVGWIQLNTANVHLRVGVLFALAKSAPRDRQQLEVGDAFSLSLSLSLSLRNGGGRAADSQSLCTRNLTQG